MAYPLGWSMIKQTLVRRERWPGGNQVKVSPLVYPGQEVIPDQPVLRVHHQAEYETVQSAPRLSLPSSVTGQMDVQTLRREPSAEGNRQREEMLPAGLRGRVVDITRRGGVIIESRSAILQGTIGAGHQVAGVLTMWQPGNTEHTGALSPSIPPGAILIVPGPVNFVMLRQAVNSAIVGLIASSIATRDLEGFLATDLVQLIDSDNVERAETHLPPLTLLLTEGLGSFAMPAYIMNLLRQYEGSIGLLSGTTAIRQGIFPDLVISLPISELQSDWQPVKADPTPTLGAQVRISAGSHEGAIGIIDYLFAYEQVFSAGVRARAVRLRLEDGSMLIAPISLVERIN